jgi:hypothetical protein
MTNQLHELPDVPLEPPESTAAMAARLALAQSLAAMKRAHWPQTADQLAAMTAVRHALRGAA